MKQVSTTEVGGDDAIDRLLRSSASQIRTVDSGTCTGLDADMANSYVERLLEPAERSSYEAHLAACAPCRRAVTSLIRLAEPQKAATSARPAVTPTARPSTDVKPQGKPVIDGRERFDWRRRAAALVRPQWALAAAAIIVLAVTVPFLLSRNSAKPAAREEVAELKEQQAPVPQSGSLPDVAAAREIPAPSPANGPAAQPSTPPARTDQGGSGATGLIADDRGQSYKLVPDEVDVDKVQGGSREQPEDSKAPSPPLAPVAGAPAAPSAEKMVARDNARSAASNVTTQSKNEPALPHIDEKETQRLPQGNKDTEQATVLKQAHAEEEKVERRDATIRPEDSLPPSTSGSAVELRARRSLAQPPAPKLAMRDSGSTVDAVSAKPREERKIHKKRFLLRAEVWTDKDYNPLKEMPVVTIIRDSDVYREVMTRHGGLKPYFTGFGEHDRAIIVFKGTVYKLIPQNASK